MNASEPAPRTLTLKWAMRASSCLMRRLLSYFLLCHSFNISHYKKIRARDATSKTAGTQRCSFHSGEGGVVVVGWGGGSTLQCWVWCKKKIWRLIHNTDFVGLMGSSWTQLRLLSFPGNTLCSCNSVCEQRLIYANERLATDSADAMWSLFIS